MINKKAVAILGGILLLIIGTVGFLIFQRSKNKNEETPPPPPPAVIIDDTPPPISPVEPPVEPPVDVPPPQPTAAVQKLSEASVVSPVLFYQGNGVAYLNNQGQLFQADLQENPGQVSLSGLQELVIPQRSGIVRVLWPNSGNNFMIERTEAGKPAFSVYVSDKGDYVDLPPQVISAVWMPGGAQILYVWLETDGKSTLNIANADNTGWQTITDFWEPDNSIAISPDGRSIAFYETLNQLDPNKLNLVTIDGKVFKSAVRDGFNAGALWSPDSRSIAFLKRSPGGFETQLWTVNVSNGQVRDMGVKLDSLDKVVWSADSRWVYAGGISVNGFTEQLHKIDAASGQLQSYDLSGADMREPFLNSSGSILFFRNNADGNKLYYAELNSLGQ